MTPRDVSREAVCALWLAPERPVRVGEEYRRILGVFHVGTSQTGCGAHVANAGQAVTENAIGQPATT